MQMSVVCLLSALFICFSLLCDAKGEYCIFQASVCLLAEAKQSTSKERTGQQIKNILISLLLEPAKVLTEFQVEGIVQLMYKP